MHNKPSILRGKRTILAVALTFGVSSLHRGLGQVVYDLTGANPASAIIYGAYIFPNLGAPYVSGSGTFNSFLRMSHDGGAGSEQGYNATSSGARMSQVYNGVSLQPDLLTRPAPGSSIGTDYYSFTLDINEAANTSAGRISLDELSIYASSVSLETSLAAEGTDAAKLAFLRDPLNTTLLWSSDGPNPASPTPTENTTLLLDYNTVSNGGGLADVLFVIPTSFFPTAIGGNANYFLYFFARQGYTTTFGGRDFQADGGFEEWSTVSGLTINPPPQVPEAGTWAGGASVLAFAGWMWIRSRRRQDD